MRYLSILLTNRFIPSTNHTFTSMPTNPNPSQSIHTLLKSFVTLPHSGLPHQTYRIQTYPFPQNTRTQPSPPLSQRVLVFSRLTFSRPIHFRDLTCSRPTLSLPVHVRYLTFSLPVLFATLILGVNKRYMKKSNVIFTLYFLYLKLFTIYI